MPGIRTDIELFRGTDGQIVFTKTNAPLDISGWTIVFNIKKKFTDAVALVGPLTAALTTPASGVCTVSYTVADTDGLVKAGADPDNPLEYWYDLQRNDSGLMNVLAYGKVYMMPQTRTP